MRFKNYINSYNKKNRIYSEEELLAMTLNDLLDNEPTIMAQDRAIGIPTYNELRNSPNTRWIDTFTNNKGEKEGGYYGSISDLLSIAPQEQEPFAIDKDALKGYPIYMNEDEEQDETPYVLQGGVEENVYRDEENMGDETVYQVEDDTQDETSRPYSTKLPFEYDDKELVNVLQNILKNNILNNSQDDLFNIDTTDNVINNAVNIPKPADVTLPQEQLNQDNIQRIEDLYKELLERLRKRLLINGNKYAGLSPLSALQKVASKTFPDSLLENEYYRNALKMKDGEQPTERFLQENDIYNYQDITDPEKSNYYKEQLAKMYGLDVNAQNINEQLKDKKIIVPKETSRLYQYAKSSEAMEKWILDNYDKIKNGEKYDDKITFPIQWNETLNDQKRGMYSTIHNANMYNVKINPDGSISGRMVDPYNFEKWKYKDFSNAKNLKQILNTASKNIITRINNNAYEQQQADKFAPFYIDMPIMIKKEDINHIKLKNNKK